MDIRNATETDLPELLKIKGGEFKEKLLHRVRETKEKKAAYLIAEDKGEIVGQVFLKYYGLKHLPNYPNIEDLLVRTDKRKQGIGTLLINTCEKLVKEKGYSKVSIQVNPTLNCPAKVLYEKLEYKNTGNKPYLDGIYNGTEDWVVDLIKEL